MVIDILNPELIVIGGIYTRGKDLMETLMLEVIKKEALPNSSLVCKIVVSSLNEQIGDYSALSVAENLLTKN